MAPLTAIDSGTPRQSTSRLRLRPLFPRSVGFQPTHPLPAELCPWLHRLPATDRQFHACHHIQLARHARTSEKSLPRAKFGNTCAPHRPSRKNIHDRGQSLPRWHGLATRSRLTLVNAARLTPRLGNQRFNSAPQHIRHRPRLVCHVELHLRLLPFALHNIISRRNQLKPYLRIRSQFLIYKGQFTEPPHYAITHFDFGSLSLSCTPLPL